MMIIAVMISALLMPAQVSAQSAKERKGNNKVQVDKKHGDKKNVYNREGRKPAVHKKGKNKPEEFRRPHQTKKPVRKYNDQRVGHIRGYKEVYYIQCKWIIMKYRKQSSKPV